MGDYKVPADLASAGTDVNSAIARMKSMLSDVEGAAKAMAGVWDSAAQAAYNTRHVAWASSADAITAAGTRFGGAIIEVAEKASSTEKTNEGVVAG